MNKLLKTILFQLCLILSVVSVMADKDQGLNLGSQGMERVSAERKKESEAFKKAAESAKGELAETLYSLSIACREEATLRDKIADAMSSRNREAQAYKSRLPYLIERIEGLKQRATSLGFDDPKLIQRSADHSNQSDSSKDDKDQKKRRRKLQQP
jgi:hypothetical protein